MQAKIKMPKFSLFFCAVFLLFASPYSAHYFSATDRELTNIVNWRVNFSDCAEFANPEFDDSDWAEKNIVGLWKEDFDEFGKSRGGHGIRWYRSRIFISEFLSATDNLAIFIPTAISAYEVYWSGTKIGESGRVATNKNDEVIGNSAGIFVIPHEKSFIGEHILAIRISNFSTISGIIEEYPKIGFLSKIISDNSRQIAISFLLVGIIFITAIFNMIFIAKSLNIKTHAAYTVLSLCFCGHILLPVFLGRFSVSLENYYSWALVGDVFWVGILSLLPIYLLQLFDSKKLRVKAAVILSASATVVIFSRLTIYDIVPISNLDFWENMNIVLAFLSAALSILITFNASRRKKKGAKTIFIGLLLFLFGITASTILRSANGWSIGFACLSCFITIVMGRYFWDEMRKKTAAEIKNARLELELLKSNIQPHFLLNSLNSIVAWIEEEPKTAVKLVSELSKELRLLMAFSEKKTVTLAEEISLCKAHIQVMNLRKEKRIKLEILGQIDGITIPPLVIHTALENGITHGFIKKDVGKFTLNVEKSARKIKISLENDGENKISQNKKENGTGNKYIVQRLSEIYGNNFTFESKPFENGWQAIYEIPRSEK